MSRVKLSILGLSTGQTSGSYTLILGEENSNRKLPIVIGSFEAQAIAVEIEKIVPFRPMTHDLFLNFCNSFDITIHEVVIYSLNEGVFHAKLICEHLGEIKEIDARTSDSIALAVRFKCPIYTYEDIMDLAGIVFDDDSSANHTDQFDEAEPKAQTAPNEEKIGYTRMTLEQLNQLLDNALILEDYASAARIRDEIQRRKK
ncbi:MAG: bifunctional nuclease family protein [Sphingobacteriales bacterium]|jgi:bifunctional DNase/RNase|nr:bifunctional nuclease family protein [Sphingobacteriales bacterium]